MIALDTNILVYSHRGDSAFHRAAFETVRKLAESSALWAVPWPAVHEFLAVVTHPGIYSPPTPLKDALRQIRAWIDCPTLTLIGETGEIYFDYLYHLLEVSQAVGPRVHDARIAAICIAHGIEELWSADRDFSRFPGLTVRNPLV
jgi:toxin-antitoxin system PIN domain toxin